MICFKNIKKKFGEKEILSGINVAFEEKKTTSIIGPSGSGKTTLIRCVHGLETPDSGFVYFHDKKISQKNQNAINRKIGIVFQNFFLFPNMSTWENIIYAPNILKLHSPEKINKKAKELLEKLGIYSKKDSMPSMLSGGQKQKVAIARALMTDPEVMIFDEPTSALDPESIKDLVALIEDLRGELTVILVTHHLSFARKISDKIIFMDQGKILCEQETADFFAEPASVRAKMFVDSVGEYL